MRGGGVESRRSGGGAASRLRPCKSNSNVCTPSASWNWRSTPAPCALLPQWLDADYSLLLVVNGGTCSQPCFGRHLFLHCAYTLVFMREVRVFMMGPQKAEQNCQSLRGNRSR